jgi:UDP-glucose 4-epimerase
VNQLSFEGKRILVTGASGFIGTHSCSTLRRHGAEVIAISRRVDTMGARSTQTRGIDCLDPSALGRVVREFMPDFVVHLAAVRNRHLDLQEFRLGYDINLMGTLNLLLSCEQAGCRPKFVFLGSCEEYGSGPTPFVETLRECPSSAYGASKLAASQLIQAVSRQNGTRSVILRPTVVYGPGQADDMFLPSLVKALLAGEEFAMTAGDQTRDFVFIDDVIDGIVRALSVDIEPATVINLSSNAPIRLKELALLVARGVGTYASDLIRFGAREYRANEAMDYSAKNQRAAQLLSWRPKTSLENGVAQTIASMRAPGAVA